MQADGTVVIDTKINTAGAETGIEDIERTLSESKKVINNYDKSIQEFVDNYVKQMDGASNSTNEFKREIETLKKQLETLEQKGMYFGDEEYDNAYLSLKKVEQALKDYKNELVSPTPDAKIFNSSTLEGEIESLANKLAKLREQGKGFGDEVFDSTYKKLSEAQEKLKEYKKNLTKKEEPLQLPVEVDTSTLEGQINLLKAQLEGLRNQGKGFGDQEFDAVALALKRAEQALAEYKNELFKTDAQREKEAETARKQEERQAQLNARLEETKRKEREAAAESARLAEIGRNAQVSNPYIVGLREELDKLIARQKDLQKAGLGLGYKEFDENAAKINKINAALKKYQTNANKSEKKTKKFNSSLNKTGKAANKAQYGLGRMLATSLLFSTVFRAISAVTSGLKEGMDNLAQYSDDTNKALSSLMSSMTQLKNAFATAFSPLVEVAAPALSQFIRLLAEAVTWTAQLLAALTGKDTFTRAVEVQQDYADSLDNTKDKTEEAADETEKALAPFDQLIQITYGKKKKEDQTGTELTPDQMFTTEEVPNQIKSQADAIKETLGGLFAPLKQSWLENGPQVMDSLKNTFAAIKQLASDVGASFMQVWNAEGYGKAITDDLLITFSNLVDTVGNLVTNFDRAWVSGETGTNILRHIGDIVLEITGFFREASESLKNWSADLDFSPLLESFDRVLIAIRPIVSDIGDLLLWFLNNVLLPLAKWGMEQAIPASFDLIAAALDALHSIIVALQPMATWLWETFLQPLGEWTGDVIISALELLVSALTSFSDWVSENKSLVQAMVTVILAFFAAWKISQLVSSMSTLIISLGGFVGIAQKVITVLKTTISTINPLYLAIAGIISVIAILAQNWQYMSPTEKVISGILAAAAAVAVLAVALGAVKGAVGAALVAGAIAAGITAATIAVNAGKRSTSSYSSSGGYSGYSLATYATVPYRMPRLATGTVVPPRAGEFAAILGDNNRETEVVSPLSTMKQALKEALAESNIGNNNQIVKAELVLDSTKFGQLVVKFGNSERNRVGVRMVAEGTT